jgi:hypothetical protein
MKRFLAFFKRIAFHPDPVYRTVITVLYCGMGLVANFFLFQVFCVPVIHAVIACILFFIAVAFLPFISHRTVKLLAYFLLGIGIPVCLYCIWFLMDFWEDYNPILYYILMYLLLALFFGLGLLAYIPVYLLYHIYRYYRLGNRPQRIALISGCVLPFIALSIYLLEFKKQYKLFEAAVASEKIETLDRNYFTERLLGIGIKYHARLEFTYDGWRPPMHDPFLNLGIWLYAGSFYPHRDIDRIHYYKLLFPNIPLKLNCPCSYMKDGATYLTDKRFD